MSKNPEWWARAMSSVIRAPSSVITSIQRLTSLEGATTLFLIQNAKSPKDLLAVISDRQDEILRDNACLAHVRLQASQFLLNEIYHCVQRLESRATTFRMEATSLLNRSSTTRWTINLFRAPMVTRAQKLQQYVTAIQHVVDVIHQFIGMHIEALDDIRVALRSKSSSHLARAIVTSCRQASSFMHAVSECKCAADLHRHISEAVYTSIEADSRRDGAHTTNIAGQLGQFWTQGSMNGTYNHSLSSHDINLTLQILQSELSYVPVVRRRMRRAVDKDFSTMWDVQRRPLRYVGLATACAVTVRTFCVHARFLGGSGLLEEKVEHYSLVCRTFLNNNVYVPVVGFYEKVFSTDTTAGNEESIAVARDSLRQMLIDFTEKNLSHIEGADELAREGSMKAVMEAVAEQARHPLRNSIAGSLGQAILLQVQKLKCDVEELMLKSKQMLKAQELNLALVALVPALATAVALMYIASTSIYLWRSRDKDLIVSGAQTARFLLGDIHSALVGIESARDIDGNTDPVEELRHVRSLGALHTRIFELEEIVDNGLIRTAPKVRMRFLDDMKLLRSCHVSIEDRKKHVERMLICYRFIRDA